MFPQSMRLVPFLPVPAPPTLWKGSGAGGELRVLSVHGSSYIAHPAPILWEKKIYFQAKLGEGAVYCLEKYTEKNAQL